MSEQQEPKPYDPNADFNEEPELQIDRSVAAGADDAQLPAVTSGGIPLDHNAITPFMPRDTNDLKALVRVIVKGGVVPESYLMKDPRGNKVPDMAKMAVAIIAGREHGKGPMWSLQYVMIVRGMPTIWGKGAKGLVMEKNVVSDYRLTWIDENTLITVRNDGPTIHAKMEEGYVMLWADEFQAHMAKPMRIPPTSEPVVKWPDALCCYLMVRRKGVDSPFIGRFSVGDAKRAKLWANLKKRPWMDYPKDMLEHKAASRVWDRGFADCLTGLHIREIIEEDGDEEPPMLSTTAARAYLGGPTIEPEDERSSYADNMMKALDGIVSVEKLVQWHSVAEPQFAWIAEKAPEKAKAIEARYQEKLISLQGTDGSEPKATEAGTES